MTLEKISVFQTMKEQKYGRVILTSLVTGGMTGQSLVIDGGQIIPKNPDVIL